MRYIKTYENHNDPQIGDWVLVKIRTERRESNPEWTNFVESNVGQVIEEPSKDFNYSYHGIKDYFKSFKIYYSYNGIRDHFKSFKKKYYDVFYIIFSDEIDFFDKDKSVVDAYLESKKYNL